MNLARTQTWIIGLSFLLVGTLGAFVLGKLAAGSFLIPATLVREGVREAPDLVGRDLEDARREAEGVGAALDVLGIAYSANVDSGEVLVQYPPEGFPISEGKPIEVLVGVGPGLRRMPDLSGMPEAAGLALLKRLGVPRTRIRIATVEGAEKGAVVATLPPAGDPIGEEEAVVVQVARGGTVVEVPSLIGKGREEARQILEAAQLEMREVETGAGDAGASGDVVVRSQDPPAGGLARTGSAVTVRFGPPESGEQEEP